ncbi:putative heat shock protein Sti1 [Scheffersomyces xylosifermentans]|uniref:putative heat shock protein Sti1 n=1 Tax=Scheffersomyces xylosifermentans TaxID=1304137 RepID=UPI00315CE943
MLSAEVLKAEGNKAFAAQQYKKAAKIYRDALKLDSHNAVLYSNRAQCFLRLQDYPRALKDCLKGLNCNPEEKLLVKLYYRQGQALKGIGRLNRAKLAFETVLKTDPSNKLAYSELLALVPLIAAAAEKSKREKRQEIKIEDVDELPEDFSAKAKLIPSDSESKEDKSKPKKTASPSIDASNTSKGTEPKTSEIKEESKAEFPDDVPFGERSSMHYLAGLKNLPPQQKEKAYLYVVNLTDEEYKTTFDTGIDADFLQFFIEAAAFVCTENAVRNWDQIILKHLKTFSKFGKYELALLMCEDKYIDEILDNIEMKSSPSNLMTYKFLLNRD